MNSVNEQKKINVKVDPETFLEVTMAQFDDKIAQAEVVVSQAALQVCELKRQKTKAILDYHHHVLKSKNESRISDEQALAALTDIQSIPPQS
jgi:hypothetical protein